MSTRVARSGPSLWRGPELDGSWLVELDAAQRAAVVAATRSATARGVTAATVERGDVDLSALGPLVEAVHHELSAGRGFIVLRGFPVDELTAEEVELAYLALGWSLGRPVGQNASGDRLTHIRDERDEPGRKVRLYRTAARQDFHTDGADLIGLLCLHPALEGGESKLVSSDAVYNELLARRPDLLEELYRPMHWDRQDDHAPGELPWFTMAPINDVEGTPRIFYLGWYLRDAQRHPEVPRLTGSQLAAMELLESIANDPRFHIEMGFERGDIQFIDNGRILHAREAYVDADDPALRRHLLRLWLVADRTASVAAQVRGGMGPSAPG